MTMNGHHAVPLENVHSTGELALLLGEQATRQSPKPGHQHENPELSQEEKIRRIAGHFREIMQLLGLDLSDDSLAETPARVARMYVKEIFHGLDLRNKPPLTLFENKFLYNQMLIEKNIQLYSTCEHHFVPITGKVHVAYFSSGKVIGLSKINRLVHYIASRPQLQERLTVQIAQELSEALQTKDIAVLAEASHFCVSCRGINDPDSLTITSWYGGRFMREEVKNEFLSYLKR